jgi:hypothetical protein
MLIHCAIVDTTIPSQSYGITQRELGLRNFSECSNFTSNLLRRKRYLNPLGTYLKNLLRMQIKIKYVAPE